MSFAKSYLESLPTVFRRNQLFYQEDQSPVKCTISWTNSWLPHKWEQKMCLKIDLSEAFNSVKPDFLERAMRRLEFSAPMISWILECVTSPQFSVLVNGSSCGYFQWTRGLWQGCPLSQYLFCIVMEYHSVVMDDCIQKRGNHHSIYRREHSHLSPMFCWRYYDIFYSFPPS